jgi:O-antigen/teichoic acid export membrane protein
VFERLGWRSDRLERLGRLSVTNPRRAVIVKLGWTTISYGIVQLIRLLNNVILARLLAPPLFGLMLIVNTIRIGIELLSDVGINQNIVSHRNGESPDFVDTAWTLQMLRGLFLGAVCFASARLAADFFDQPELAQILPVAALFFVFTGFNSAGRALAQKQIRVKRLSIFEIGVALFSLIAHATLALITPTIWALVLGSVVTGAFTLVGSYFLVPHIRHRIMLDRPSLTQLLVFGKWIFLSSIIYFLAMNFDRLYFSRQISLTELGIFGIARTLADTVTLLAARCGSMLLFPMVAAMQAEGAEVRQRLQHDRRLLLLGVAIALSFFVAVSDRVVAFLYDERYQAAAILLPVLLLGAWFAVLSTVNESILTGIRKPAASAFANIAKFVTYLVAVPLAFQSYGLTVAVLVLSAGEAVKYVTLWVFGRREHLGFGRDDLVLTFVFVIGIVGCRELLQAVGLTPGLDQLFPWLPAIVGRQ